MKHTERQTHHHSGSHVCIQQQVLRLEVSVADLHVVAVPDATQQLPEVVARHVLAKPPLVRELVEELPARDKLRDVRGGVRVGVKGCGVKACVCSCVKRVWWVCGWV